ncbi:MAG: GNAT family N-acetyltransferase [Rhodospirillales bacterium]|nr:GNAT family N-acetyltransferase [Rhodospirillales bacterium]
MTAAPVFRRADPHEGALLRAITREAYAKWVPVLGREPLPMTTDHDAAVRAHHVEFVETGARAVAAMELVFDAGHLLIENIAVRPEAQRRGLGDLILARAETVARERGYSTVRLYTNSLMAGNVDWYRARGYAVEREEPFGNGARVHLAKSLSG